MYFILLRCIEVLVRRSRFLFHFSVFFSAVVLLLLFAQMERVLSGNSHRHRVNRHLCSWRLAKLMYDFYDSLGTVSGKRENDIHTTNRE